VIVTPECVSQATADFTSACYGMQIAETLTADSRIKYSLVDKGPTIFDRICTTAFAYHRHASNVVLNRSKHS